MGEAEDFGSLAAIAGIEHDLRQPLQSLVLLQSALSASHKDGKSSEILAGMGHAIDALEEMLANLMITAKLDAGRLVPNREAVPLSVILGNSAAAYAAAAERKGLRFRVVSAGGAVDTDADMIGRVVRALVSNAVAFTEQGRVLLGVRHNGRSRRIEVWDTGTGIPSAARERIFGRFYSDDLAMSGRAPHIGLGLSVARELTSLLGHQLSVRSWPGQGTVFAVTCLVAGADGLPDSQLRAPASELAGATVIVAGDGDEADEVSAFFNRWRAEVIRVSDAEILPDGATPALVVLAAGGGRRPGAKWEPTRAAVAAPVIIIGDGEAPQLSGRTGEVRFVERPFSGGRLRALAEHLLAGNLVGRNRGGGA